MSFPTTSVLDSGAGTDANPVAGSWSGPADGNGGQLKRLTNQFAPTAIGSSASYWNPGTFAADQECFITLAVLTLTTNSHVVYLRGSNMGNTSTQQFYLFLWQPTAGFQYYKAVGSSYSQLGASIPQSLSAGDKIGAEILGSTITGHYFTSGAWNAVSTRTDSAITGAGFIAQQIDGSNGVGRNTNFGGGATVITSPFHPTATARPDRSRQFGLPQKNKLSLNALLYAQVWPFPASRGIGTRGRTLIRAARQRVPVRQQETFSVPETLRPQLPAGTAAAGFYSAVPRNRTGSDTSRWEQT